MPDAIMEVPDISGLDTAFGNVSFLPEYEDIPSEFHAWHNPHCRAASEWFFRGAKPITNGIIIGDTLFKARPGVNAGKALGAIRSVLASFEPKHEHKISGCGYMLSQWFEVSKSGGKDA